MSYEHCDTHDEEATNGCESCIRERQAACRHVRVRVVCLDCYKDWRAGQACPGSISTGYSSPALTSAETNPDAAEASQASASPTGKI